MRRHLPAAVLLALIAACGGQPATTGDHPGGHPPNSAVVEGAREIPVSARLFAFDPAQITVAAGEDVTIVLTATDAPHDFTVEEAGVHVVADMQAVGRGGLRIDEPGTYTAFCSVPGHREGGMEAEIVVR